MEAGEKFILRPRRGVLATVGLVLSPVWGIGLWLALLKLDPGGLYLVGLSLALWTYAVGGVRVIANADAIELRRAFVREWRVATNGTLIREGVGGDIPVLPAVVFEDRNGKTVRLVTTPFHPIAVKSLLNFLTAHGAKSVQPHRLDPDDQDCGPSVAPLIGVPERTRSSGRIRKVAGIALMFGSLAMFFWWGSHFQVFGSTIRPTLPVFGFFGWIALGIFGLGLSIDGWRTGLKFGLGFVGLMALALGVGILGGGLRMISVFSGSRD